MPSTAVDRNRTCANAGDGLKNLAQRTPQTAAVRTLLNSPNVPAHLTVERRLCTRKNSRVDPVRVRGHVIADVTDGLATRLRNHRKYSKCRSTFVRCHFLVSGSVDPSATRWRHSKANAEVINTAMSWYCRCNQGTCTQWSQLMTAFFSRRD